MIGRVVVIDGELRSPEQAAVSVYDRGFLFGDSVFEVLRTYRRRPFALDEHLARLERSAAGVYIELPLDRVALHRQVALALAAVDNDESYVRIVVTRGTGPLGLDPDNAVRPLVVVLVEPLVSPARAAYVDGVAVATCRTRRATDDTAAVGAKVGNYLANLLAIRDAKRRGAFEALVVDADGAVVEGASSNVFVVRRGRLATPPESAGILAGITRAHVLRAARDLGLGPEERPIDLDELVRSDEVFITSSIREIVPVVRVDSFRIGAGIPGPSTRALHGRFRAAAGLGDLPMPFDA